MNGVTGLVSFNHTQEYITAIVSDYLSSESFINMEGLCMFEPGTKRLRTGGETENEYEFVESWR